MTRAYPPTHPGEILLEEFMEPLQLSEGALAEALSVHQGDLSEVLKGRRPISADLALRLGRFFGTTPELWMNLQSHCELEMAKDAKLMEIERDVQVMSRAEEAPAI